MILFLSYFCSVFSCFEGVKFVGNLSLFSFYYFEDIKVVFFFSKPLRSRIQTPYFCMKGIKRQKSQVVVFFQIDILRKIQMYKEFFEMCVEFNLDSHVYFFLEVLCGQM